MLMDDVTDDVGETEQCFGSSSCQCVPCFWYYWQLLWTMWYERQV